MNHRLATWPRAHVAALCSLAVVLCAAPAWAQNAAADEALVQQGIELRRQGRDAEALALFERAMNDSHTPRSIAQVALAEQALGRWVVAERHLQEALAQAADPWIVRSRSVLDAALGQVGQHLGTLEIDGGVDGATVRVDGREQGALPAARRVRLARGEYELEVEAPGYYPVHRTVVLSGASARESIEMRPRASGGGAAVAPHRADPQQHEDVPPPEVRAPSEPVARPRVAVGGVVLASAGGASMIVGAVLFALRSGAESELRTNPAYGCTAPSASNDEWVCLAAAQGTYTSAQTLTGAAHATMWGGLALAVGGVAWIAVASRSNARAEPTASRAELRPWVARDVQGAALAGSF